MTGEDVANSLYYIHMDQPTDDSVVPRAQGGTGTPRTSSDSVRSPQTIARKPLPSAAKTSQMQNLTHEAHFPPGMLENRGPPSRKPVMTDLLRTGQGEDRNPFNPFSDHTEMPAAPPQAVVHPTPVSISRKPLGPRPFSMDYHKTPDTELLPPPPGVLTLATPPTADEPRFQYHTKPLPPPGSLAPSFFDNMPATNKKSNRESMPISPSRSPSPGKKHKQFTPFCLTIIRRDPTSGHQWNIGKVSSFQSNIMLDAPASPDGPQPVQYPRGYPVINVHIETSGYARFRGFPATLPALPNMDSRPGSSSSLTKQMKDLAAATLAGDAAAKGAEEGFSRQVVMAYGKTWTHNLKGAFKKRERAATTTSTNFKVDDEPLAPPRASFQRQHKRNGSGTSTGSNGSVGSSGSASGFNFGGTKSPGSDARDPEKLITQPGPGVKPKGYMFVSPWDGHCEFRTSSSGRSLKCRHVRNTTSQGFNPLVAAQTLRDGATTSRGRSGSVNTSTTGTAPVSELRFNLPSSDLFHSKEDREKAARELQGQFNKLLRLSHDENGRSATKQYGGNGEHTDDDESIFDFSGLGKENAGGGNRGKRAKLGKLLVHDEGLKMLDLVIAANMGIWWQAWERSF